MRAFLSPRSIPIAIVLFGLTGTALVASHLSGYAGPTLSANVAGDDVQLSWSAASFPSTCTQAREYHIWRQNAFLQSVNGTTTSYTDQDVPNGSYEYKVQAKCNVPAVPGVSPANTNNLSVFSNIAEVTISSAPACAGAPDVSASATPLSLWPPNGKLVPVTVSGVISPQQNCSVPETISYWIVDEYGELSSLVVTNVAVQNGGFSFVVNLEASRLGEDLDGRTYEIYVETPDGGSASGVITVPHDQRKK